MAYWLGNRGAVILSAGPTRPYARARGEGMAFPAGSKYASPSAPDVRSTNMPPATGHPRPPVLDYALHRPSPLRLALRRHGGKILFFLVCALLGGGIWQIKKPIHFAFWHWRCSHFTAPPTLIAFEGDPTRADALLAHPGCYSEIQVYSTPAKSFIRCAGYNPECWGDMQVTAYPLPGIRQHTAFLHQRTRQGQRSSNLVKVHLFHLDYCFRAANGLWVYSTPWDPSEQKITLMGCSETQTSPWNIGPELVIDVHASRLRLYFGQVDPADDSHFTIKYEIDNLRAPSTAGCKPMAR